MAACITSATSKWTPSETTRVDHVEVVSTQVLYFGDVQMDAVDSIEQPREREVPAPGLGPAVDHCHKRAEELEIDKLTPSALWGAA